MLHIVKDGRKDYTVKGGAYIVLSVILSEYEIN